MNTQDPIQTDPFDIRRMSAAEQSAWHARIVREARIARDAALAAMLIRCALAMVRGTRALASAFHDAFALRDAMIPAPQQSRSRARTHLYQ